MRGYRATPHRSNGLCGDFLSESGPALSCVRVSSGQSLLGVLEFLNCNIRRSIISDPSAADRHCVVNIADLAQGIRLNIVFTTLPPHHGLHAQFHRSRYA